MEGAYYLETGQLVSYRAYWRVSVLYSGNNRNSYVAESVCELLGFVFNTVTLRLSWHNPPISLEDI